MTKFALCIAIILVCFSACTEKKKTEYRLPQPQKSEEIMKVAQDVDPNIDIVSTLYVIDTPNRHEDIKAMSAPDSRAKFVRTYSWGDKLQVIGFGDNWVAVLDSYTKADGTSACRKLYVEQSQTGTLDLLHLNDKELSTIIEQTDDAPALQLSSDSIEIKIIDKATYDANYKHFKNPLLQDTLNIRKQNGVITLPCANKRVVLTDIIAVDNDSYAEYTYLGQIEELNAYAVRGGFYEWEYTTYYNKTTGEKLGDFSGDQAISLNKEYLVDIWSNPYEDDITEFALYKIGNSLKLSHVTTFYFPRWIPFSYINYDNEACYFFGKDNYLYLKITDSRRAGSQLDDADDLAQYIRMKIKI